MTSFKSVQLLTLACANSWAAAATCYRANVGPNSVVNLKSAAQLLFLEPTARRFY